MSSEPLQATKEMCYLCFETLENACKNTKNTIVNQAVVPPNDNKKCPMFVTWKKDGDLRGCIGIFEPIPLYSGLKEYAIVAGFRDPRFPPINHSELSHLSCGISLLHSFEPANDCMDWEIGKHGIRLFIDGHSSTFLPQVASEQGWDKDTTLQHLARKGGFYGKFDEAAKRRAKVTRYQSSKLSATWEEYQQFLKAHQ